MAEAAPEISRITSEVKTLQARANAVRAAATKPRFPRSWVRLTLIFRRMPGTDVANSKSY